VIVVRRHHDVAIRRAASPDDADQVDAGSIAVIPASSNGEGLFVRRADGRNARFLEAPHEVLARAGGAGRADETPFHRVGRKRLEIPHQLLRID
jgi:hypothetical protein